MPYTQRETSLYINSISFSIEKNFEAILRHNQELENIRGELRSIEQAEEVETDYFKNVGQWSVAANYYHAQYVERMKALEAQKDEIGTDDKDHIHNALIRIGATEEAMATIAGSNLQIAKQVLSHRYGAKSNLPTTYDIKTLDLTEIIWEGRNHAMHWEEANPNQGVKDLLHTLDSETDYSFVLTENNSWKILEVIGWESADDMITELNQII